MGKGKDLSALKSLEPAILSEVVREGEERLKAQFDGASAADQRGLAWSGFVITLATAAIGASAALGLDAKHHVLAIVSGLLALAFSVSAFFAIDSVRPRKFCYPGNYPENWLPEEWEEGSTHSVVEARIEQARCLNNQIFDNRDLAAEVAERLRLSIDISFVAVTFAAIVVLALAGMGLLTR